MPFALSSSLIAYHYFVEPHCCSDADTKFMRLQWAANATFQEDAWYCSRGWPHVGVELITAYLSNDKFLIRISQFRPKHIQQSTIVSYGITFVLFYTLLLHTWSLFERNINFPYEVFWNTSLYKCCSLIKYLKCGKYGEWQRILLYETDWLSFWIQRINYKYEVQISGNFEDVVEFAESS